MTTTPTTRAAAIEAALLRVAAHTLDDSTSPPALFCWCNPGRTAKGHSEACLAARAALTLPPDAPTARRDALWQQVADLREALHRLTLAAARRESTMGDVCRLIEVQGELRAATAAARAALAKVQP